MKNTKSIFDWRKCCLTVLTFGANFLSSAAEPSLISGENGEWTVHWRGIGSAQVGAYNLPHGGSTAVRAIDAARDGNFSAFCASFLGVDTNSPPEPVKTWYEEWGLCARHYFYLIVEEALLSGQSGPMAAISFAPATPQPAQRQSPPTADLKARVVFARKVESEWKLLPEIPDNKAAEQLRNRASRWTYRPNPNVFQSAEEAREAHKRRAAESQANILQRMKERGASVGEINAAKEGFQLQNTGASVRTWDEWQRRYRPEILDPPIEFDARDSRPVDFSTPLAAFWSFEHAIFSGDKTTLLANADESGKAWLKKYLRVDENESRPTYEILTNMSRFTVLLTASNTFEGKDYMLVLSRRQQHSDPEVGRVSFNVQIFRHVNGTYQFTGDLSFIGPFGRVRDAAGASEGNLLPYPQFHEKMRHSAFPPHFYTIDERK